MKLKKISEFFFILFNFIKEMVKYFSIYPIAKLKYRGKEIWLVSEAGSTARDNGFHFYKYLKENYPEIESYYIISKDSSDYSRVKSYGNIIDYKSF